MRLARSGPLAALWTGFGAAAVGCFLAVVGALLSWIPDAGATGTSGSTVRAGVLTFLAAQHGGVRLNDVTMHFVPLGLTIIAVWLCLRAGRVLHALPAVQADRRSARMVRLTGLQVVAYAVTCAALAPFSVIGSSSVPPVGAILGAVVVSTLGFGLSVLRCSPLGRQVWRRLPVGARAACRGAGGSIAIFLVAGALLAAVSTAVRASRFLDLSRGLSRGVSGLPIAVLDLLSAPNAVLAATAYLAGPGFAVGVHSTYAPFGAEPGLVPAFPVLAGLPAGTKASSVVLVLMILTVVGAGAVTATLVRRAAPGAGWFAMIGHCLLAAVITGLGLGLMVALAGGSLGRENLRAVGASPWQVVLMVAVEVGVVAVPVALGARLLTGRFVQGFIDRIADRPVPDATVPAVTVPATTVASVDVAVSDVQPGDPASVAATVRPSTPVVLEDDSDTSQPSGEAHRAAS